MIATVLFVSVRNAGRTQMAAAWVTALAHPDKVRASSAGIIPADAVDNNVVDVMKEVGINLSSSTPRLFKPHLEDPADLVVVIAPPAPDPPVCGVNEHDLWLVDDPVGAPPERVREIRRD